MISFLKGLWNPPIEPRPTWPIVCVNGTMCVDHNEKERSRCIEGCAMRRMVEQNTAHDDWMR